MSSVLTAPRRAQVIWVRPLFQLLGSLFVAVAVPYALAAGITPELLGLDLYYVSLAASVTAIALAFWTYRNLAAFPGIRSSYYILPVFLSSFVAVFTVLFLARLGYKGVAEGRLWCSCMRKPQAIKRGADYPQHTWAPSFAP